MALLLLPPTEGCHRLLFGDPGHGLGLQCHLRFFQSPLENRPPLQLIRLSRDPCRKFSLDASQLGFKVQFLAESHSLSLLLGQLKHGAPDLLDALPNDSRPACLIQEPADVDLRSLDAHPLWVEFDRTGRGARL